jgi:hypothetical protein
MNRKLQAIFAACGIAMATHAAAQITFYEREGLRGRAVTTDDRIPNLDRIGFNDRVSSLVVERGRWEVCEHARFEGRCVVLRPGRYGSLREIGMNNSISSARRMDRGRHHGSEAPPAVVVVPQYEQPRPHYGPPPVAVAPAPRYEPPPPAFYDVPVTSARAVVGPPSQRCWIDREQVAEHRRGEPNIGGAVVGGLSVAFSATRSEAAAARTSPRRAESSPAPRSGRTSIEAAAQSPMPTATCNDARR